jgi:hypothetical protein
MFVKLGEHDHRMVARTGKVEDLFGILRRPGRRTLGIDEINEGIAEGGAASGRRGFDHRAGDEGATTRGDRDRHVTFDRGAARTLGWCLLS